MQQDENMLTLAAFELGDLGEVEHGEACLELAIVVQCSEGESYLMSVFLNTQRVFIGWCSLIGNRNQPGQRKVIFPVLCSIPNLVDEHNRLLPYPPGE